MSEFALLHGAGTGGWLWNDVAERLRDRGHVAHTPSLIGVGERIADGGPDTDVSRHVTQVIELIEANATGKAILVGFSYGGVVVAGVADRIPERVAELVFLDAFVPRAGQRIFDVLPPAVGAAMEASAVDGWRLQPAPLATVGGLGATEPGVDQQRVRDVLQNRGSHPIGTYRQVLDAPFQRSAGIPRRFISCTDKPDGDPIMALAAQLKSDGWRVQDLPTGHFAMLTMPSRLTDLLVDAPS